MTDRKKMDDSDSISHYRNYFNFPVESEKQLNYLCGNSLGLQPKAVVGEIAKELERWSTLGVEGHFEGESNWIDYHYQLKSPMAAIVGALPEEVTLMNTLTVNLHLMLSAFYKPSNSKIKILIDHSAFPSDKYAIESFLKSRGVSNGIIELPADDGELVSDEAINATFAKHGHEIALVVLGGVNYYTGQFYNIKLFAALCQEHDCILGLDLAHAVGNVPLHLHEDGVDFAVWCTYKYLNSGPGSIAGMFIHEKHFDNKSLTPLRGWWGQDRGERFLMSDHFKPMKGAEAFQISNLPILSLVPLKTSLSLHNEVGMEKLRTKSIALTGYLEELIYEIKDDRISILTPSQPERRGAQLSIKISNGNKSIFDTIRAAGTIGDWRHPNVIRLSPAPIYNSFEDVEMAVKHLKHALELHKS